MSPARRRRCAYLLYGAIDFAPIFGLTWLQAAQKIVQFTFDDDTHYQYSIINAKSINPAPRWLPRYNDLLLKICRQPRLEVVSPNDISVLRA